MRKLTKAAAAVGAALAMGYGGMASANITAFSPSGYAESELLVSNFRFLNAGTSNPLSNVIVETSTLTSTISSSINGIPGTITGYGLSQPSGVTINPIDPSNPIVSHASAAGPNAGNYTPFLSYPVGALGPGTFAGSASDHSGNGLQLNGAGPTTANTQAQVNINGSNSFGSADARQTLGSTFIITVTGAPNGVNADVFFDAQTYLRIALGQPQVNAAATRSWSLTVRPEASLTNLLSWVPNGDVGGLSGTCTGVVGGCSELFDPFDLNIEFNLQNTGDLSETNGPGTFGVRAFLPNGRFVVTISHETNADASVRGVPEPGTLALVGAAIVGFAGLRRKAKSA